MSIKSDRWIRQMAREQELIDPFEPGQVREVNGERIVSYGTSSYGYDVRCADEFKIFTNIESAFVDPKSFDESSFVDKRSDVCVIPPNNEHEYPRLHKLRPRRTIVWQWRRCANGG